jgi:hypothetical protein
MEINYWIKLLFWYMYRSSFIILYYARQMHNYLTSVIICEIIVYLLVIVQNNKRCTVHV